MAQFHQIPKKDSVQQKVVAIKAKIPQYCKGSVHPPRFRNSGYEEGESEEQNQKEIKQCNFYQTAEKGRKHMNLFLHHGIPSRQSQEEQPRAFLRKQKRQNGNDAKHGHCHPIPILGRQSHREQLRRYQVLPRWQEKYQDFQSDFPVTESPRRVPPSEKTPLTFWCASYQQHPIRSPPKHSHIQSAHIKPVQISQVSHCRICPSEPKEP